MRRDLGVNLGEVCWSGFSRKRRGTVTRQAATELAGSRPRACGVSRETLVTSAPREVEKSAPEVRTGAGFSLGGDELKAMEAPEPGVRAQRAGARFYQCWPFAVLFRAAHGT